MLYFRLRHLHSAISKGIPTHALLTILSECHSALASESHLCVLALSNILRDNVAALDKAAALSVTSPFLAYFLEAFKYRKHMAPKALLAEKDIILVEDELIETFMTLSLKLSLDDFKPMFYRYYYFKFFHLLGNLLVKWRHPGGTESNCHDCFSANFSSTT